MWRYDEDLIRSTTQQEILDAVNLLIKSPWFGYDLDYSSLLGGVERNETGHIVSAKTAHLLWTLQVPEDAVIDGSQGGGLEIDPADKTMNTTVSPLKCAMDGNPCAPPFRWQAQVKGSPPS